MEAYSYDELVAAKRAGKLKRILNGALVDEVMGEHQTTSNPCSASRSQARSTKSKVLRTEMNLRPQGDSNPR